MRHISNNYDRLLLYSKRVCYLHGCCIHNCITVEALAPYWCSTFTCYTPPPPASDLHSITSLLVQALLSQFSEAFVDTGPSPRVKESSSLREFLTEDYTVLLLLSIQITSHQVRTVCTSSLTSVWFVANSGHPYNVTNPPKSPVSVCFDLCS